jgi:hypothetical protein
VNVSAKRELRAPPAAWCPRAAPGVIEQVPNGLREPQRIRELARARCLPHRHRNASAPTRSRAG